MRHSRFSLTSLPPPVMRKKVIEIPVYQACIRWPVPPNSSHFRPRPGRFSARTKIQIHGTAIAIPSLASVHVVALVYRGFLPGCFQSTERKEASMAGSEKNAHYPFNVRNLQPGLHDCGKHCRRRVRPKPQRCKQNPSPEKHATVAATS